MGTTSVAIDQYIADAPEDARATLEFLRRTIRTLVPDAAESVSYGLPTFSYQGRPLIYFGAARKHCALYGTSKGTVRFPHGEPPPESVLRTFVEERIATIEAAHPARKPKPPPRAAS